MLMIPKNNQPQDQKLSISTWSGWHFFLKKLFSMDHIWSNKLLQRILVEYLHWRVFYSLVTYFAVNSNFLDRICFGDITDESEIAMRNCPFLPIPMQNTC